MEKIALMINGKWLMVKRWVKENRGEFIVLLVILLVGAFFRLYKIDQYMTFLGDEGRDVITVRRLLVNGDLILVGPGTSIGNMYLGPLYYYLMAPALLLANFSPVGPAVMIGLLGVATIYLVWYVAREWFPTTPALRGASGKINIGALIAAGLYAISPVVILYSRSSWNPNIMPFFSLLCIYALWKIWSSSANSAFVATSAKGAASEGQAEDSKRVRWLIVLGVAYAFVLQSHYLGLLLAPVIGLFWFITLTRLRVARYALTAEQVDFVKYSILSFLLFVFLMSPLVIFDARHGWRNFAAIKTFFTQREATVSLKPWNALPKLWLLLNKVSTRLVAGTKTAVGKWVSVGIITAMVWIFVFQRKKLRTVNWAPYFILGIWFLFALFGLGVYKQEIYDHYFGFLFTAPFLLIGGIAQVIVHSAKGKGILSKLVTYNLLLVTFIILVFVNLRSNPLNYSPNRQLQRTIEVSQKIRKEAGGNKFNLAVIAERNYEGAYQYFLEAWHAPIIMIDPQRADETIAEQLFVVCELAKEACDPTHNPKAQVANFGWSKIDAQWEVGGVILYKLVHYQ